MTGIYETVPASPEDVEVFGESLTDAYLRCRVWGHDPDPNGNTRLATDDDRIGKASAAYWVVNPGCTHGCGVRWLIYATLDGEVVKRALDYSSAPGYLCEAGRVDTTGRNMLRREYFLRSVGEKKPARKTVKKGAKKGAKKAGGER